MKNHQLINASSGKVDFWTPQPIIEAARKTLGRIDLDPASNCAANERVKATKFFNEQEDGLTRLWGISESPSTVWLNQPFKRETNAKWVNRLIYEYDAGRVSAACCIAFASTSEAWFKPLLYFPMCFLVPRTNYLTPDGKVIRGVTKGSCVTYLGRDIDEFREAFSELGVVKI
jgi:hypothetical protein